MMSTLKKAISLLALTSLLAMGTTGCGKKEAAKSDEIKIGALYELTGGVANYGKAALNGAQMAVDEINAKGGINGKKINRSLLKQVTQLRSSLPRIR